MASKEMINGSYFRVQALLYFAVEAIESRSNAFQWMFFYSICLDTDNGIISQIEIRASAEHAGGHRVALDFVGPSSKCL